MKHDDQCAKRLSEKDSLFKVPPALAGGKHSNQMALAETKEKYQSSLEL